MKTGNTHLLAFLASLSSILWFSGPALAVDDGARVYWKAWEGTTVVSFQYLNLNIETVGTQQFAPGQFVYPSSDVQANIFIANWGKNLTLFGRPSSVSANLAGGDIDVEVNTGSVPALFLPPGVTPGSTLSVSSSGFADPSASLVVNLIGTPPLRSVVDLLNYEPTWTLDVAALLAVPLGEYDENKLVNLGQNRWFGRIAFPFKYHFGPFVPGHRNSIEIVPSAWLFADNDDFLGRTMGNDPLWQLEGHLTHDFTRAFFASLDLLYRGGFQSSINGVDVGDELDIGDVGFTLNFQVTDNAAIRTGFSSNVFGDSGLNNAMVRLQFVYGWNPSDENQRKLLGG